MQKKYVAFGICGLAAVALIIAFVQLIGGSSADVRAIRAQQDQARALNAGTAEERGARLMALIDKKNGVPPSGVPSPAPATSPAPAPAPAPDRVAARPATSDSPPSMASVAQPQVPAAAAPAPSAAVKPASLPAFLPGHPSTGTGLAPAPASVAATAVLPGGAEPAVMAMLAEAQGNIVQARTRFDTGMNGLEATLARFASRNTPSSSRQAIH